MSNDVWRWVIGLAVIAHGLGHVLFMPLFAGTMNLQASGHSWLLSGILGDEPVKWLGTLVASVALVIFVAAGVGLIGQMSWWRPLAIAGSVVSMALVLALWDGLPVSNALFALAFDLVVLAALLLAHWPSEEMIGT